MPTQEPEVSAPKEETADSQAEIEAQAAHDSAEAELASVHAELQSARTELVEVRASLQQAVLKYREARLATAPHIPSDLVPGQTVEEIDRQLEAAQKVVAHLREKLEAEARKEEPPACVPVGAPPRRPLDLSALSPTEKIKLGLQQLAER